MRLRFTLRLAMVFALTACAAWLPAQSFDLDRGREPIVSLDGLWRFHAGDSPVDPASKAPAWAQSGFDDAAWSLIRSDESWSDQGYTGMGGFAWYRFTVKVPAGAQPEALLLAPILTSYEVFVDGQLVGGSGKMPPARLPSAEISYHLFPLTTAGSGTPRTVQVAVRVWHSHVWASYVGGGTFSPGSLAGSPLLLGAERRHRQVVRNAIFVDLYSYSIATALIGMAILCLFLFRPAEREYLWFAFILLAQSADNVLTLLFQIFAWPPQPLNDLLDGILIASGIAATLCFFYIVLNAHARTLRRVLLSIVAISPFLAVFYWPGWASPATCASLQLAFQLPAVLWVFGVLLRRAAKGNLDAQLLLLPTLLDVGFFSANNLAIVFHQAGWVNLPYGLDIALPLPPFTMHLSVLLHLFFLLGMLVFLIRRFTSARRREVWLASEMEAAREVQQVLLPDALDQCDGFAVTCVYQPADEVGGDFFQQMADGKGGMLIVVGDVSGKGLPAAMLVSVLVGAIRAEAAHGIDPARIMHSLNERMVGRSHGGFTTSLAAHITADGLLTIANAGHLAPYLNGREIEIPGSLPLGLVANMSYETTTLSLAAGDRVTFVSDGVVEAQGRAGELFGFERTREISNQPAEAIAEAAQAFGQKDDITVVTVDFAGSTVLAAR